VSAVQKFTCFSKVRTSLNQVASHFVRLAEFCEVCSAPTEHSASSALTLTRTVDLFMIIIIIIIIISIQP
jgi:hypothetical protein